MTFVLPHSSEDRSPVRKARVAGFCWLMTFVTSAFALFVGNKLIVFSDAAVTARNLLEHESLFRWGTATMIASGGWYIATTLFVYQLLRPVNKTASLLMAFFSFIGCALGAFGCLFEVAPFLLLKDNHLASIFTVDQLRAASLLFLKLRVQANNIGLVFFGIHCVLIGGLILQSKFLPRILGGLMLIAGLGWLTFLSPPLAQALAPYNLLPGGVGEFSLTIWFLAVGVNGRKWNEQDSASRSVDRGSRLRLAQALSNLEP